MRLISIYGNLLPFLFSEDSKVEKLVIQLGFVSLGRKLGLDKSLCHSSRWGGNVVCQVAKWVTKRAPQTYQCMLFQLILVLDRIG